MQSEDILLVLCPSSCPYQKWPGLMRPEHPSHRELSPASGAVTWVGPSQDGAHYMKELYLFLRTDIMWWLIKEIYLDGFLKWSNRLISIESSKVRLLKRQKQQEKGCRFCNLVIIQSIIMLDMGSVPCHTETVTGHCLTINNISDSWKMSEGPVNTSQAANIYPLVRLCTSNGLGPCPGCSLFRGKVPSNLSQLFARCPILYL